MCRTALRRVVRHCLTGNHMKFELGTTRDSILAVLMFATAALGHFNHHDAAAVVALVAVVFLIVTRILARRKRKQ
jgi:hypothetical protein